MKMKMKPETGNEQDAFFVADLAMHGYCLMADGSLLLNGVAVSTDEDSLAGWPLELASTEQVYV